MTPARQDLLLGVGAGLHVVAGLGPVDLDRAVLELAALLHGVKADPLGHGALGQLPDRLRLAAMLGVGNHPVRRQAVGEGAHLPRGAAGRGLAGQREGTVAGLGDLAGQQVEIVDQVVYPDAAGVLVDPHGPEGHDLGVGVGVEFGELLQAALGDTGLPGGALQGEGRHMLGELLEAHRRPAVGILGVGGRLLERMLIAQPVADVVHRPHEIGVILDEVAIHTVGLNDVVGDIVENHHVGIGRHHHGDVGQIEAAVLEGGEHRHLGIRVGEPAVGDPGPEDRMHLRHVGAPQHEGVGGFDVVIHAHRLVGAEGAHEGEHRRGHAVPRVGVDVVGAQPGLEQLAGGVALPDRPLAGAEHRHALRPVVANGLLELLRHQIQRLVPGDRLEIAALVVDPVALAQHRPGQPVLAVEDLGEEVALDAVEAAIDLRVDVTVGGHDAIVLGRHHHAAAHPAEATRRLVPVQLGQLGVGDQVAGAGWDGHAGGGSRHGRRVGLGEFTTGHLHDRAPSGSSAVTGSSIWW